MELLLHSLYCTIYIGIGSKFKVGGLDFKTWILTIICVKIYVKCMHPLLKSGGAEAPPAPPSATPLVYIFHIANVSFSGVRGHYHG